MLDEGEDIEVEFELEDFAGDGTGGDAGGGFAGGGAAAALDHTATIFGIVGEVGVGRAVGLPHFVVGGRAGIFIGDVEGDGGAQGFVMVDAGEDLDGIGFLARGSDIALTGPAAVEVVLDILCGEGEAGGASINDDADGTAVAFAVSGNLEEGAEDAGHDFRMGGGETGFQARRELPRTSVQANCTLHENGWFFEYLCLVGVGFPLGWYWSGYGRCAGGG